MKKFLKKYDILYLPSQSLWTRYKRFRAFIESAKFSFKEKTGNKLYEDIDIDLLTPAAGNRSEGFKQYDEDLKFLPGTVSDKLLQDADKFANNEFRIFGRTVRFDGIDIDWSNDMNSGYRWPLKYYKCLYPVFNIQDSTDGKFPYELSRFNHAPTLGIAYRLTGNEKYSAALLGQVNSWIKSNPYLYGINWTCTMDVSIRLCNWIIGYLLIRDCPCIPDDFLTCLSKSVCEHIQYICDNPEREGDFATNHYIADLAGLLLPTAVFPKLEEKFKIHDQSMKEFINAMTCQIYPDGCDFEASTCYHRLVLEFFFFVTYALTVCHDEFDGNNYQQAAEKIFGREYVTRLYAMFDAVYYISKPGSEMPQLGDNDSGSFIRLYQDRNLDMRYLLSLGAVFFREPKWKIREFFSIPEDLAEVLVLYGKNGKETWDLLEGNSVDNISSKAFNDSGWYVMRDKKNYAVISCGPNGQKGRGGHCHSDKLSFELCVNGRDMIVDPGTYTYTAEPGWRNIFRSTAYHNTVVVDALEASPFKKREVWTMQERSIPKAIEWKDTEKYSRFIGEHYGYRRLDDPVTHRREIYFEKHNIYWIIKDTLTARNEHKYELYLHFSPMRLAPAGIGACTDMEVFLENLFPGSDCRIDKSLAVQTINEDGNNIVVAPVNYGSTALEIETGFYSREYGCKTAAPVVKYTKCTSGVTEFITVICPV